MIFLMLALVADVCLIIFCNHEKEIKKMIEYFTTRDYDDEMAQFTFDGTFREILDKFENYDGVLSVTVICDYADIKNDYDEMAELLMIDYYETETLEILAKAEFNAPDNFSPVKMLDDLNDCFAALSNFFFSPDGKKCYLEVEILKDNNSDYFLERYFTKRDDNLVFEIK